MTTKRWLTEAARAFVRTRLRRAGIEPDGDAVDAAQAFEWAIADGALSNDPAAPNWAGRYMWMFRTATENYFKHKDTRQYLKHRRAPTAP